MIIRICHKEASERLNLNNVAKVERKESLLALPRPSNVSQKPQTNAVQSGD